VLSRAFIGVSSRVLDDGAGRDGDGAVGWLSYLSASRMTTQRLTTLLVSFIGIGTLAAMITTSDPMWWTYHFSQLGTFGDMSSFLFNGTLIAGGLLVTTFTLYVSHDLPRWASRRAASVVGTALAIMGVMLACVGIFPVNVNMLLHNLSASDGADVPAAARRRPVDRAADAARLLPRVVGVPRRSPRLDRAVRHGYFGLTAFEIIVFALIFGWLAVFIRFMVVADQPEPRS
jgi:hypothetical protein